MERETRPAAFVIVFAFVFDVMTVVANVGVVVLAGGKEMEEGEEERLIGMSSATLSINSLIARLSVVE